MKPTELKRDYNGSRIKQLIPATGVQAAYASDDGELILKPLAGFALLELIRENDGKEFIATIVAGICEDEFGDLEDTGWEPNFLGYLWPDNPEHIECLEKMAKESVQPSDIRRSFSMVPKKEKVH